MVISLLSSCFPSLSPVSVHWESPQSFSSAEVWPSSQRVACAISGEEAVFLPLFVSILAWEFLSATLSLLAPAAVTNISLLCSETTRAHFSRFRLINLCWSCLRNRTVLETNFFIIPSLQLLGGRSFLGRGNLSQGWVNWTVTSAVPGTQQVLTDERNCGWL